MLRSKIVMLVAVLAVCAIGGWAGLQGWSQEAQTVATKVQPGEVQLRNFMRQKLEACHQILEVIATDNMALVKSGAETLNKLSGAEEWRVSNDAMYRQFSAEFQQTARQLSAAAEKENFDEVTLKWISATLNCVDCHKFVRGMRIAN